MTTLLAPQSQLVAVNKRGLNLHPPPTPVSAGGDSWGREGEGAGGSDQFGSLCVLAGCRGGTVVVLG